MMGHPTCEDIGLTMHTDDVDWSTLVDNRDFDVVPLVEQGDGDVQSKEELRDSVKLHWLMLRCLTELCRHVGGRQDDRLNTVTSQLKTHYAHCAQVGVILGLLYRGVL